jgi:hypothetical protein
MNIHQHVFPTTIIVISNVYVLETQAMNPNIGHMTVHVNTSKNQSKCHHSICDYMRLNLKTFAITRPNFNYFGHSLNYDATIRNFVLLVVWILGLFSFINRLICPISHNNHQISYTQKVFYNDIGVYFDVLILYIYIYMCV